MGYNRVGEKISAIAAALLCFTAGATVGGILIIGGDPFIPDKGVNFNGENSYAVVDDGTLFDLDTFSISAWVKMRDDSGSQMFVNRGDYGGLFSLYYFDPRDRYPDYVPRVRMLVEHLGESLDDRNASYQNPPINTWTHYVGIYDGQHVHLYVNGVEGDRPRPAEGRIDESDTPLYIGALQPYEGFFDGELEDIRIHSRAVSAEEVIDIMKGATGGSLDDGLEAHWRSDGVDVENEIWYGAFEGAPVARYYPDGKAMIADRKYDGYKGIWFALGQVTEYGDKYSGGLGTYTANHVPMAIYAPEVNKTFFVYGGSRRGEKYLLAMASYYDHENHRVPRPTIVHDKLGVDDPHDNPSLAIDEDGYIWVFVTGRSTRRDGYIYRSLEPYSVDAFEMHYLGEFTYSQPWWVEGEGFLHLHTKYSAGRELYFNLSEDGKTWTEPVKIAGMGGHYQVSNQFGERIITSFMMHPGGSVDKRTNLYYLETSDMGNTWRTVDGQELELPLGVEDKDGPALIHDYEAEGRLVYINDTQLDADGNPVILYVTSTYHEPGPPDEHDKHDEPRYQKIARWDGQEWHRNIVSTTTHNYDVGSIYIEGDLWRVFAPAEPGPQEWGTGGEVAIWESEDKGENWVKTKDVTRDSQKNHSYVRRSVNAHSGFYAFWADGNPDVDSEGNPAGDIKSKLYFADYDGNYWELPYEMEGDYAEPEKIEIPDP